MSAISIMTWCRSRKLTKRTFEGGDDEAEGRICRRIRSLLRRDGVWPARRNTAPTAGDRHDRTGYSRRGEGGNQGSGHRRRVEANRWTGRDGGWDASLLG